jgi:perosamine synthetase
VSSRIPLAVPDLGAAEARALARCVEDNWVSSAGPDVTAFEATIADLAGVDHGVAVVNGTAALHLVLLIAGVKPGDRVIVPDWTFAATANAVRHAGATPVFVDVTAESWTLDPALLPEAIKAETPAAIVAVHALGHPADMDAISEVARERGVPVIEDAAGAIGAALGDRPVGGLGDAAIFSLNGNKTVTAGGGGAIVTRHSDWAARARHLSTQARTGAVYRHDAAGFNYRMPNLNAALGLAQLGRLPEMLAAKRVIAARYDAAFAGRGDLLPMPRCDWSDSACWLYSVRCADRTAAVDLIKHIDRAGAEARLFWEALSDQDPYLDYPSIGTGVAATLSGTVVSLPCSSSLSIDDQVRVIDAVAGWHGADLKDAA